MIKSTFALLACLCLAGCATLHKTQAKTTDDYTHSTRDSSVTTKNVINTTKTQSGKITITEIVFNQLPLPFPLVNDFPACDTSSAPVMPDVTIGNDGIVDIRGGNIVSVKQTTIETSSEQTGKTYQSESSSESEEQETKSSTDEAIVIEKETPKEVMKAPKHIMVTAIILATLVAVIWLALKRKSIVSWIMKVLAAIKRLFM